MARKQSYLAFVRSSLGKIRRKYFAAPLDERCKFDIRLSDGSGAQCMRRRVNEHYCLQHTRIVAGKL